MKRALVSCAAFALIGAAACSSSNPTVPPGAVPVDSGEDGRVAAMPPDTRPPPSEAGAAVADTRKGGADVPLGSDASASGIDAAPPSILSLIHISEPTRLGMI